VKGWKKFSQPNWAWKKAGVAILISDEIDIKPKLVRRDNEGHFILIKQTIHQEAMKIVNTDAPNTNITKLRKQTLLDIRHR
jgi:hypothetical protein